MAMTRLATATYSLSQLPTLFSSPSPSTNCKTPTEYAACTGLLAFPLRNKWFNLTKRAVKPPSSSDTLAGVWEEPDDGTESDYEDEYEEEDGEETEENGLELQSDWEPDVPVAATAVGAVDKRYTATERMVAEVEQLLGSEELAILHRNATPDLSKISSNKWKPLQTLALSSQIGFIDALIDDGLDIDTADNDGLTALHKAIIGRKGPVIDHLLRKGASPHVRDRDGATPLHYAVQVGALQTVKLLMKYKVDVNVADAEGWTPLHVAVQSRNRDITKTLLINGADKTRRNQDGKTPLELSLSFGKEFKGYEIAMLLKVVPYNTDPL